MVALSTAPAWAGDHPNVLIVVIDDAGLVVTNWNTVRGQAEVNVVLKRAGGDRADLDRVFRANVIRVSRFSDLALLEMTRPPRNLTAAPVAGDVAMQAGEVVHAIEQFVRIAVIHHDARAITHLHER